MGKIVSFEEYKNRKEEKHIFSKEEKMKMFENLCCDDDYELEEM